MILHGQIIEAGHFYAKEWFSKESADSRAIWVSRFANPKLLFIDDVHPRSREATDILPVCIQCHTLRGTISQEAMYIIETANGNNQVTLDIPTVYISPEYIVLESEMLQYTMKAIEILEWLSRKKWYKFREGRGGFCSNQKLLDSTCVPTCIGYDVWLTYFKDQILWYNACINILSEVYREQQEAVKRVFHKLNPEFMLDQLYY